MAITLPVAMAAAKESDSIFLIELYIIQLPTYTLRLCNADQDIAFAGNNYLGFPIQRGNITRTVDSRVDNCEITVSNTNSYFTLALLNGKSFLGCQCTILQILYPDSLTDASIVRPVFYGKIDEPKLDTGTGKFTCQIVSDIPNMSRCRTMGYSCDNCFGDENCKHSVKAITGTCKIGSIQLNGITRQILTSTSFGSCLDSDDSNPKKWLNAIVTIDGVSRKVIDCADNQVTLEYAFPSSIDNTGFAITQNCDKTTGNCDNYHNREQYSGFLAIPWEYQVTT